MRSVSINGHDLNQQQLDCLREVLLLDIASNSDIIRDNGTTDLTVFYHYRQNAMTLVQLIDKDPLVNIGLFIGHPGLPGSMVESEPAVMIDGVRMNIVLCMEVRMAISSSGFHMEELTKAKNEKNVAIEELDNLVGMIFDKNLLNK